MLVLIVSSINWADLGRRKLHKHQILRRINWEYLRGDVPHSAQIAVLQQRLFSRPLTIRLKAGTEVLELKNLHRLRRICVIGYKNLVLFLQRFGNVDVCLC